MHKINYYKKKFDLSLIQGSTEWHEYRRSTFGGSEIATVLNENKKYETWQGLLDRKKNKTYHSNDNTMWGILFEPLSKHYLTKTHGTIYEFGTIPFSRAPVSYSPDGLILNEKQDDVILIEIKNPIYRGVNSIPEQYLCQIQTGLNIFSAEYGLFCQFRFRRCKLYEKPWTCTYDRQYHKEYRKRCKDKHPISYGYLYWETEEPLTDLAVYENMSEVLNKLPPGVKVQFIIEQNLDKTVGIAMMYKLFDMDYKKIERNENYLKDKEHYLWNKYKELQDYIQ